MRTVTNNVNEFNIFNQEIEKSDLNLELKSNFAIWKCNFMLCAIFIFTSHILVQIWLLLSISHRLNHSIILRESFISLNFKYSLFPFVKCMESLNLY